MKIGICKIQLRLPENDSLKGKRRVLKSLTARVGHKFNISVAEVEDHDRWQLATIGLCCVGNDASFVNQVLSRVISFIEDNRGDAEMLDYETEIIDSF